MINDIIEAVKVEQERIEEPRNRSRYFIFGKLGEQATEDYLVFVFQNAPERVIRDARYHGARQQESLFKVGDVFISGYMTLSSPGLAVAFTFDEIAFHNIEPEWLQAATARGIEYVMDNRDLNMYIHDFLDGNRMTDNPFLEEILVARDVMTQAPLAHAGHFDDLNPSQNQAIEKILSQRVTFVWGPPGTGKTKTLAAMAATLVNAKKRVLLSALSNMALDQLLAATVERLDSSVKKVPIARTGSRMDREMEVFGRRAFQANGFRGKRAGAKWAEHVENSRLVAANFTMLSFPGAVFPGVFDYVIADEVSMANIPNLAAATFYATGGIAFGGDPYQLPPIYPEDSETPNEWFRQSVFEKAGIIDRHDPRVAFLDTQYRMQTEIGDLVSDLFYGGELLTGTAPLPVLPAYDARVVFIQSSGRVQYSEAFPDELGDERRFNEPHADAVVDAVKALVDCGVSGSEIGVITPYNAQVVVITQKLKVAFAKKQRALRDLKVSTVHSFQGQERRVIVVDFTDDNVPPTHLTAKWELINVALSRAKEQLVIVGNRYYLTNDEFFSSDEVSVFGRMLEHAVIVD